MNTKRIPIIEDDIQFGHLKQEVLEQHGYACVRAFSGTEALLLEREQPDLVLLDLMLPGLSGTMTIAESCLIPQESRPWNGQTGSRYADHTLERDSSEATPRQTMSASHSLRFCEAVSITS